jgi:hypothetical protein
MANHRFHSKPVKDGQTWGNWRLNFSNLTLDYIPHRYEIDLESIDSSSEMADWIFQISMKSWASAQDLGNLVLAIEAIFYPQANLCSGGNNKTINAKAYLEELFGAVSAR